MKNDLDIHETSGGNFRILVDGKVHPLLVGFISRDQAEMTVSYLKGKPDGSEITKWHTGAANKAIVLYHGDCMDGKLSAGAILEHMVKSAATWSKIRRDDCVDFFFRKKPESGIHVETIHVRFMPVFYNKPTPDVSSFGNVMMTDFCYPPEELIQMAKTIRDDDKNFTKIEVMDHHSTSWKKVAKHYGLAEDQTTHCDEEHGIQYTFDMSVSGANLVLRDLTPRRNKFFDVAEDYDLHKGDLATAVPVVSYFYENHIKDDLDDFMKVVHEYHSSSIFREQVFAYGKQILNTQQNLIDSIIDKGLFYSDVLDADNIYSGIPICYGPRTLRTSMGAQLAKGKPFSITYEILKDGKSIEFSLRSEKGSDIAVNVGDLAVSWGGGGHPSAAGVTMDYDTAKMFITNFLR